MRSFLCNVDLRTMRGIGQITGSTLMSDVNSGHNIIRQNPSSESVARDPSDVWSERFQRALAHWLTIPLQR